jgi:hypothetical protein
MMPLFAVEGQPERQQQLAMMEGQERFTMTLWSAEAGL